jgi:RNA-directed DNA polymerase
LPIDKTSLWLLRAQNGRCAICKDTLFAVDDRPQTPLQWEQWLTTTRKTVIKIAFREAGTSDAADSRLIHAHCRNAHPARNGKGPALLPAYEPTGLA